MLLGPTGSGKTPLGEALEKSGFRGRRCRHFDFGASLRSCAAGLGPEFTPAELQVVRESLATGVLLKDQQFPIAAKILNEFISRTDRDSLIILNGLPRHTGQAAALNSLVEMAGVIVLECDAATVMRRIASDTGGDRGGRSDDGASMVARKLTIYEQQTTPLIEYYRSLGVPLLLVAVGKNDGAETLRLAAEAAHEVI
ncbi:Adenylate kinase or related kinase [Dehalogenimonas alkenigignens]|uniref:Adenylate kinase n=1 Tax=Dehalogenimonas alkenigignens TaxID=1217799 RepID=A0A0W0GI11_9CHLR|nr:Adenylate kinase or related kinase [Dehalogenimonas alkenigignens]